MEGHSHGHRTELSPSPNLQRQARIWFESLETRRLFSVLANTAPLVMLDDANNPVATVQIIDGTLTVTTTNGIDDAMIGTSQSHPGQLFVHNNGARSYFSREGITGISVNLGDGDDAFCFHNEDGLVNLPTTINGGAGDDEMGGETDRDFMDVPIQIGDGPFAPYTSSAVKETTPSAAPWATPSPKAAPETTQCAEGSRGMNTTVPSPSSINNPTRADAHPGVHAHHRTPSRTIKRSGGSPHSITAGHTLRNTRSLPPESKGLAPQPAHG